MKITEEQYEAIQAAEENISPMAASIHNACLRLKSFESPAVVKDVLARVAFLKRETVRLEEILHQIVVTEEANDG
jgi:hypothetical protein